MFRLLAGYSVAAWLILQVASIVVPAFSMPGWMMPGLIVLLAFGLPFVFALGWIYELTPEGLKRTTSDGDEAVASSPYDRRIDLGIMLALFLAVMLLLGDRFLITSDRLAGEDGVPSIAVLAFVSMSDDPEDGFFSDGISEEILNLLAHVQGLRVSARTSSFQFKGENRDIREIGKRLGVRTVLEGSVRRSGDRLRVTAQLIDVSNGYHLWSETFDSQLKDVFEVQDRIAGKIARTLEVKLLAADGERRPRYEPSIENYQKYLLAQHLVWERTREGLGKARLLFESIIIDEPDYAEALAGLAEALMFQSSRGFGNISRDQANERAGELVAQALDLNSELAEGQSALGHLLFRTGDNEGAMEAYDKAIALKPSSSEARYFRSFLLGMEGRHEESLAELEEAGRINPASWKISMMLASRYMGYGRFEEVYEQLDRVELLGEGPEAGANSLRAAVAFNSGEWAASWQYAQKITHEQTSGIYGVMAQIFSRASLGVEEDRYLDNESFANENIRRRIVLTLAGILGDYERARMEFDSATPSFRESHNNKASLIGAGFEAGDPKTWLDGASSFVVDKEQLSRQGDFQYQFLTTSFALACEEAGNLSCFRDVTEVFAKDVEVIRVEEMNIALSGYEACLAALEHRPDDLLHWLGVMVEGKSIAPFELDSRAFEAVRDRPEYNAMRQELHEYMNAERAKLGWEPIAMKPLRR